MKNKEKKMMIFDDATIERLMNGADVITKAELKIRLANENKLSKKIEKEKSLSFGNANLSKIKKIVDIEQVNNSNKFEEWFNYRYELQKDEEEFLRNLIKDNIISLQNYNEQTLTVKFIGLILYKVKFSNKHIKDWYGYKIECKLNNYLLSGEPDFIVATGIEVPETPYFFLQEYKRSVNPTGNPEYQVLAAMLSAMTLNNTNEIKGGFIIGRTWNFVILEKTKNENYEYFVSYGFDCLRFDDLKQIYINLQAVKFLYCE